MSILIDENTTFIVQGITGREAVNLTRECLDYGSKIVGGVTPGRKGREVHGVPVFDTVQQVVEHNGGRVPDGSVVTVPPAFTKDAVLEAIDAGVGLIVVVTERIPRGDVAQMVEAAGARRAHHRTQLPRAGRAGVAKMGGIGGPAKNTEQAYQPGSVGVMSRSGGMTTEILDADGRRPRRLDRRLDRRRRDHRVHLRRADAAVRGRRADRGDRDLHRARRAHGGAAGRLGRGERLAPADRPSWRAASWTTRR